MKYEFMILLFLSVMLMTSFAYATSAPDVIKSQDKLSTVYFIPSLDPQKLEFELINIGNGTAYLTEMIKSDLFPKIEHNFSILDSRIDKDNIVLLDFPSEIRDGESETISFQIDDQRFQEGTYSGRLFIDGANFTTIPVDLNVVYTVSPWFMLGMNLFGVFIAVLVGRKLQQDEKKKQEAKRKKETFDAILHVSEHLVEMNTERNKIFPETWKIISTKASNYVEKLETEYSEGYIIMQSQTVQHFEKLFVDFNRELYLWKGVEHENRHIELPDIQFLKRELNAKRNDIIYEQIPDAGRFHLQSKLNKNEFSEIIRPIFKDLEDQSDLNKEEIVKNTMNDKQIKFIKNKVKKEINSRDYGRSKKIFFGAALILSSLTSLLVIDSFVGHIVFNAVFAIGTGFTVYRLQDLQKLMKLR